ncbi:MAG: hypothetical protein ACXABY_03170 [Candidatus Thorarchaeota archaeon]
MGNVIRCRCGVWTDYGLTCSKCKGDSLTPVWSSYDSDDIEAIEEDLTVIEPEEDVDDED